MVMTRSTAVGSKVTGSIMLGFAIIAIICGAISFEKFSGEAAASAGLWSLYLLVPGILSIVAGATKNGVVMGFALFFNLIAVILSIVASICLIIIIVAWKEIYDDVEKCHDSGDQCKCDSTTSWDIKCSDIDTVYWVFVTGLVAYIILVVTTFTASIFGCLGTCCAPVDPIMVVTPGVPVSMMHSGYGFERLPAYGDKSGLV